MDSGQAIGWLGDPARARRDRDPQAAAGLFTAARGPFLRFQGIGFDELREYWNLDEGAIDPAEGWGR